MHRVPLRARLTAGFAVAMAAVLVTVGVFVYVRVRASLTGQIDEVLVARSDALAVAWSAGTLRGAVQPGTESFAQVVDGDGDVLAATAGYDEPLLDARQRAAASRQPLLLERELAMPAEDELEPARLLATPAGDALLVVGASLEDRDDALDRLLSQLVIGGPLALVLSSGAGYVLAGTALRPVERMRRRAAAISAESADTRLPLPPADDEVHRLGATLNAMLDRLDEGLRRERRFVADASHELRTPLALLRTELELALRRPRSREELEAAVRSALQEVDRLTSLADDLLVLASAGEGHPRLHREPLDLRDVLQAVAGRFAARAAADGAQLSVASTAAGRVVGDRRRLEQALGNLVDNALRQGAGEIVLDAHAVDGQTVVEVADRGPGFPPDFLDEAFERFTRPDEARTQPGSGLGLAIVDAIVRAHDGHARAHNRPDGGARVELVLPAA